MSLSFDCPSCGKGFTVGDHLAGKTGKCKQCGGVFTVPSSNSQAPPPADVYGLDDATDSLPPRVEAARPSANAAGKGKGRPAAPDAGKAKGFFAGLGGSGFVLIFLVLRLVNLGNRAAKKDGPPPLPQVAPAFAGAPAQPWTMPALPDRGPMREFQPGVTFQEVRVGPGRPAPGLPPGHGMTLYFYLPPGDHEPGSLPCVLVAPAGSILITGMGLGEGDQAEHLPYVRAGFAVLSFSLDGDVPDLKNADDSQIGRASSAFLAAKAGLTNAAVALEWLSAKAPEVDPGRVYVAGHSSAGTFALLLAENEPRVKKCAAFAPRPDVASNFSWLQKAAVRRVAPGVDAFFTTYNPATNPGRIGCPVFLFHARDDSVVPASASESFAATLKGLGKDVTLDLVPKGDHYQPMITEGIPKAIAWFQAGEPSPAGAR